LERELQDRERELSEQSRTDRNLDREIKSLEYELNQKEKARGRLEQELQRSDERNAKLKQMIDEMMNENTTPTKLGRFASTRTFQGR
jgi:septal ring factor EnvC (AmiA/AmiB activator)